MSEVIERRCTDALLAEVPLGYGMTSAEARKYVRAVITCLREPDEAMLETAKGSFIKTEDWLGREPVSVLIWRAMIDAALGVPHGTDP